MSELGDEEKAILTALSQIKEPAGCAAIGGRAGINWRRVMGMLRGLKKAGYVESPVKGKYVITDRGRQTLEV